MRVGLDLLTSPLRCARVQIVNSTDESFAMIQSNESAEARELGLLEAITSEPEIRQADLATKLGVAVGTVNWLLKRMGSKGWIKVRRIGRWRWNYILTPVGLAEKARLTRQYLDHSMTVYRQTRAWAREQVAEMKQRGFRSVSVRVVGDSNSDLGDVCRLTCVEHGMKVLPSPEASVPSFEVDGLRLTVDWPQTDGDAQRDGGRERATT